MPPPWPTQCLHHHQTPTSTPLDQRNNCFKPPRTCNVQPCNHYEMHQNLHEPSSCPPLRLKTTIMCRTTPPPQRSHCCTYSNHHVHVVKQDVGDFNRNGHDNNFVKRELVAIILHQQPFKPIRMQIHVCLRPSMATARALKHHVHETASPRNCSNLATPQSFVNLHIQSMSEIVS